MGNETADHTRRTFLKAAGLVSASGLIATGASGIGSTALAAPHVDDDSFVIGPVLEAGAAAIIVDTGDAPVRVSISDVTKLSRGHLGWAKSGADYHAGEWVSVEVGSRSARGIGAASVASAFFLTRGRIEDTGQRSLTVESRTFVFDHDSMVVESVGMPHVEAAGPRGHGPFLPVLDSLAAALRADAQVSVNHWLDASNDVNRVAMLQWN